jgi:Icc-related predicted phosphoesterase
MRFAVIGDIHSNLPALEAVLNRIKDDNVDFIASTGDLVGYAPFPNEVIDLIRSNHIVSIQGNYDKAVGNKELICGCDYSEPRQLELASLSIQFTNRTINVKIGDTLNFSRNRRYLPLANWEEVVLNRRAYATEPSGIYQLERRAFPTCLATSPSHEATNFCCLL